MSQTDISPSAWFGTKANWDPPVQAILQGGGGHILGPGDFITCTVHARVYMVHSGESLACSGHNTVGVFV